MQESNGVQGWQTPARLSDARVHMVGIGGCGMSGLAALLMRRGAQVSGVDRVASSVFSRLVSDGAVLSTNEQADVLPHDIDVLVASAAVRETHDQLAEARRRGIPVIKYAQLLGEVMRRHQGIAVSGTHGKSTTTAWLSFLMRQAGLDPSFVVGAESPQLGGGSGVGDGPHFIAEACEYDRSFHWLRPHTAVILNIEEDHLDCYENLEAIVESFKQFADSLPADGLLILNGEDRHCRCIAGRVNIDCETFGRTDECTWRAVDAKLLDGRYRISILHENQPLGHVHLGLPGEHNVMNALAVTALASRAGVEWPQIEAGLREFKGARRRLQIQGAAGGITVVDDYAHHPTEIRATLKAAREYFKPRRIWCVFQPHQHSRTRFLLDDFASSFELADFIVVPKIYFVRDSERERQAVCAADLVERVQAHGGRAMHIPEFDKIIETLTRDAEPGDLVITMGAGDIWKAADELVQRLRTDRPD